MSEDFPFTPEEIAAYTAATKRRLAQAAALGSMIEPVSPVEHPDSHKVPHLPRNYGAYPNPELPSTDALQLRLIQILPSDAERAPKVPTIIEQLTGSKSVHPDTYATIKSALDGLVLENIALYQAGRYWLRGRDDDTVSDTKSFYTPTPKRRQRKRTHRGSTQAQA